MQYLLLQHTTNIGQDATQTQSSLEAAPTMAAILIALAPFEQKPAGRLHQGTGQQNEQQVSVGC